MTENKFTYQTKNQSGIEEDLTLTREEVRAIKKLAEDAMIERRVNEKWDNGTHVYPLGGSNWVDLSEIRTKCKMWLVRNQS